MNKRKGKSSKVVKVLPLSVAITALATGASFADADVLQIETAKGSGKYIEFDVSKIKDDPTYRAGAQSMLKAAWKQYRAIIVKSGATVVDINTITKGQTAADVVTSPSPVNIVDDPPAAGDVEPAPY